MTAGSVNVVVLCETKLKGTDERFFGSSLSHKNGVGEKTPEKRGRSRATGRVGESWVFLSFYVGGSKKMEVGKNNR